MKSIRFFFLLIPFLGCNNTIHQSNLNSFPIQSGDTSIHPKLEMGGCYLFLLNQDSIVGLILHEVRKEEDSIYYSFFVNGQIFKSIPTKQQFEKGGVWGRKIPSVGSPPYIISFSSFSISEGNLKPHLLNLSLVGTLNLSQRNFIGSSSHLKTLTEVGIQMDIFKFRSHKPKEEDALFPSYPDEVFSMDQLALTDNPNEVVQPRTVWRLSKKTAHPKAVALMKEDWFWSEADDLSPFGNDDGADAFYGFRQWRTKNMNAEPTLFILQLERDWGTSFAQMDMTSERELEEVKKRSILYSNIDRAIIGIALGQIALEGTISDRLRDLGIKAIDRTLLPIGTAGMEKDVEDEYKVRLKRMREVIVKI